LRRVSATVGISTSSPRLLRKVSVDMREAPYAVCTS
jgi:hypothetical protein